MDDDDNFIEYIENPNAKAPDEKVIEEEMQKVVRDALDTLTEREAIVATLYFGLGENRPETFQEIADRLGLTRQRIQQINAKVMLKLVPILHAAGAEAYL